MTRQRAACGCELGSVFALAALVAFSVYLGTGHGDWSPAGAALRGLAWVIGSSVVGKILGLSWARLRLHRLRAELRRLRRHAATVGYYTGER